MQHYLEHYKYLYVLPMVVDVENKKKLESDLMCFKSYIILFQDQVLKWVCHTMYTCRSVFSKMTKNSITSVICLK